jgi:hypothetical protein
MSDDEYYENGDEEYEGGEGDDDDKYEEQEYVAEEEDEVPIEEEQQFVAGVKQFELAGGGLRSDVNLKSVKNPVERFRIIIAGVANTINDNLREKPFSRDDFIKMSDKVAATPFVQYKNPSAFVLGYFVTRGGTQDITIELLRRAIDMLPIVNQSKDIASPPDIVRYATFWREVLK